MDRAGKEDHAEMILESWDWEISKLEDWPGQFPNRQFPNFKIRYVGTL